jgi:hypothetical protein
VSVRLALGVAVLVPLVPWSQARIDRLGGGFRAQEEVLYVWSGEHVKRLLPGFEAVAADIYWLRTVQYFGGQRLFAGNKRFELLRPLVEITVTLDPRLEIAYRYGAIFLSENPPIGAGRPREGIELLEKGARNLPRSWRLRQDLGFFHYLFLKDADRAAATLSRAAEIPGAPFWLRTLAADLAARGGDRASARRMWQQMYDQADEVLIKENARARLLIYDSLDAADRLGELVQQVEQRTGYRVRSLEELRERGLWPGPLTDAAGVPFRYDVSTGRASIAPESPMWRPE